MDEAEKNTEGKQIGIVLAGKNETLIICEVEVYTFPMEPFK